MNKRLCYLLALFTIFLNCSSACFGQIVPERYGDNPASVDWQQTETAHFTLVFPRDKSDVILALAPEAEQIFKEYRDRLGTAPPHKITIYYNDVSEMISGIRAQNTDADYSIWTGNPLTPPSYSGEYMRKKALRIEIAYAFQEAIEAFPIDYWYYVFSRPFKSPWSDGFISYLAMPQQTPLEVSTLRYYQYMQDQNIHITSPLIDRYNESKGRSQIRYFEHQYQDEPLKKMYTWRSSLLGVIPYFDFNSAFEQVADQSYDSFQKEWAKHTRLQNAKDKAALSSGGARKGRPVLKRDQSLVYHGAALNSSGSRLAAVTQPTTGSFEQQLRIINLKDNESGQDGKVISEGYFQDELEWNGSHILAFAKRDYDSKKGSYFYRLYILDTQNGSIQSITDQKDTMLPGFSPNGKQLVYVEKTTTQNIIWLQDLSTGLRKDLYAFARPVAVTQIEYHPLANRLLISYEDADGTYKAGIFDISSHTFSALPLQAKVPMNARWNAGGDAIYFNKESEGVANIFRAAVSGTSLGPIAPVTTQFWGTELWDVVTGSTSDVRLLAKTGETVSFYSGQSAKEKKGRPAADAADVDSLFTSTSVAPKQAESSSFPVRPYRSFLNVKWEPPFGVPYYLNSGDFGFAGYLSLLEPMRIHEFDFTGILSLSDPWGKSFFYSSYVNNSFKPRLELDFNHFPAASGFFGTSRKVKTNDVVALTSLWKLGSNNQTFTKWYGGLTLRYMAFSYFPEATLHRHHPTVFLANHKDRQTDLRAAIIRRNLKPSRNTLIHPLDGNGMRFSVTASDKVLGSQTRYARFRWDGYTILPGIGNNRLFLYGNAAIDTGVPAGRDYLSFGSSGNYQLPDPSFMGSVNVGLKQFVRGYKEPLLGNRFVFGKLEYRIPYQFGTTKKFLGLIPPARTSFTFFADGGVMGDARVSADERKTKYRYSLGAEIKHVFGFGRNFKVTAELGLGQPLNRSFGPNPYVNLRSAIPF